MPTVQEFADAIGCSTAGLRPLNDQILEILLDRVNTEDETSLVSCDDIPLLHIAGASTIPLLQPAARDSLQHVIEIKDRQLNLKHAFRTIAQQFVLREWVGNCGITSARKPGMSDHERGLAIDIDDNATWRSTLIANGWHWAGPGDKGHFNFIGDDINPNVLKGKRPLVPDPLEPKQSGRSHRGGRNLRRRRDGSALARLSDRRFSDRVVT